MTTSKARRHRASAVAWMADGTCVSRADLPWIADSEQTSVRERLAMTALCQACPVRSSCAGYANREKVTAGFWAGSHRDPDAPKVGTKPGWAAETLPGLAGLGGAA